MAIQTDFKVPTIKVEFTNWRGERRMRHFLPSGKVDFGSNNYHPEPHFYMQCMDMETGQMRDCALSGFHMETLVTVPA